MVSRQGAPTDAEIKTHPDAADPDRRRLSVLLLCDDNRGHAGAILDHIAALTRRSIHEVRTFNPGGLHRSRWLALDDFDVVVVHYSLVVISDHYLPPEIREKLRLYEGLKVQFIQDDYRWVDEIAAMMRHLGIHVLFTLVPEPQIARIWDERRLPGVVKVTTLAGYVPEGLIGRPVPPLPERPLDIGYRGRTLPYWIGRIGQEKAWIAQGVLARAAHYGLRCDVGWREEDRIYGRRWIDFLSSCRATLGTESGATITDFDGSIEGRVKEYLRANPSADFEQVHRDVLEPFEGNVRMNVISPRCFEAIALRTALILFPGDYSGVLVPWRHYIPLARDFSNMDEVVEKLRDDAFLEDMTSRAYREIAASPRYSYAGLVRQFDEVISSHARLHPRRLATPLAADGTRRPGAPSRRSAAVERHLTRLRFSLACLERRLPTPSRLRSTSIGTAAKTLVRTYVLLRLVATEVALRKLLRVYLADPEARRSVPVRDLVKDALRLGLLVKAASGRLEGPSPFRISAEFDPDQGHLSFVSRPRAPGDGHERAPRRCASMNPAAFAAALATSVRAMAWDHSAIATHVACRWNPWATLRVNLGDHGIYRFDALLALSPSAARAALLPFMPDEGADLPASIRERSV